MKGLDNLNPAEVLAATGMISSIGRRLLNGEDVSEKELLVSEIREVVYWMVKLDKTKNESEITKDIIIQRYNTKEYAESCGFDTQKLYMDFLLDTINTAIDDHYKSMVYKKVKGQVESILD